MTPPNRERQRWDQRIDQARTAILLIFGLAGIAHETVRYGIGERPFLITAFLGMMGLPFILNRDQSTQKESE